MGSAVRQIQFYLIERVPRGLWTEFFDTPPGITASPSVAQGGLPITAKALGWDGEGAAIL